MPSEPDLYSKCACANCGGHIEFPRNAAGETITCPHCAWPTKLPGPDPQLIGSQSEGDDEDATEERPRRRVLVLVAGAAVIVVGAMCAVRYVPTLQRSFFGSGSQERQTSVSAQGTGLFSNRDKGNVVSTNAAPGKIGSSNLGNLPSTAPDVWHGLVAGPVHLEKTDDSGLVYAVGNLHNATDRQRFGVKVVLDLFGEHNRKMGTATDYTQWIEPGKDWKFKALVSARGAVRAAVAEVAEQ